MKNIIYFLFIFTCFNSLNAQQENIGPRIIIKTNFLPTVVSQLFPICGEYRLVYEQAVPLSKNAFLIGLSYNSTPLLFSSAYAKSTVNGIRFQAQYKYYLTKDKYAPTGAYIGPHFSYNYAKVENSDLFGELSHFTYVNFNILFGYQLIADERFAVDIFSGLGYKKNEFSSDDPNSTTPDNVRLGSGAKFTFGFNFGIAL